MISTERWPPPAPSLYLCPHLHTYTTTITTVKRTLRLPLPLPPLPPLLPPSHPFLCPTTARVHATYSMLLPQACLTTPTSHHCQPSPPPSPHSRLAHRSNTERKMQCLAIRFGPCSAQPDRLLVLLSSIQSRRGRWGGVRGDIGWVVVRTGDRRGRERWEVGYSRDSHSNTSVISPSSSAPPSPPPPQTQHVPC